MYSEIEHARRMTEAWQKRAREQSRVIKGYTTDQWGRMHGAKLDKRGIEDILADVAAALVTAMKDNPKHQDYFEMTYARVIQARADLMSVSRDRRRRAEAGADPTLPLS